MKQFKVWAVIEEVGGDDTDPTYTDVGEPVPLGTFDSFEAANMFVGDLSADGHDAKGAELA